MTRHVIAVGLEGPWLRAVATETTRKALPLLVCDDVATLITLLRDSRAATVFMNAGLVRTEQAQVLRGYLVTTGTACILCGDLSPECARTLVEANLGAADLGTSFLLREMGRERQQVSAALRDADTAGIGTAVEDLLGVDWAVLPYRLEFVLRRALISPAAFFDATDLARLVGLSRRSLDRLLEEHGIGSARRILVAIKVLHAVHRMQRGVSVTTAATALGYANRVVLTRHLRAVFGVTASRARKLTRDERAARVCYFLRGTPAPSGRRVRSS